jgi:hypothetical protein
MRYPLSSVSLNWESFSLNSKLMSVRKTQATHILDQTPPRQSLPNAFASISGSLVLN